ncbi:hypothetical protein Tco_0019433 [Tanacetum coccineum]
MKGLEKSLRNLESSQHFLLLLCVEHALISILKKKRNIWNLSLKSKFLDWNAINPSLKCQLCQQHGIAWRWYKIFFTDEFGDRAFQRWSDIGKVGMEALVSYLVAASMVKSPENARFSLKLKKLIVEHPSREAQVKERKTLASVRRTQLNEAVRGVKDGFINDVPQLVDKKGGSYTAIAPKLEPRKFNKWKRRMLCYLAGMEPYYLKCIKDGLFQLKKADGDAKPQS